MSARGRPGDRAKASHVRGRVAGFDWRELRRQLDETGHARLPRLLGARECAELTRLYPEPRHFRKRVDLARHGFGAGGDYQYFDHPLPPLVAGLRAALYPRLAAIANAWNQAWGREERFPRSLTSYLDHCRERGQAQPTPLLLRYRAGGFNRLHQDLYGPVAFPLQVAVLLSSPDRDFAGGEFLLVEQRARMQSRGEAIALARGEGVVFPTRERPVRGARGPVRASVRHGMSRLHRGQRFALGLIFHDAS